MSDRFERDRRSIGRLRGLAIAVIALAVCGAAAPAPPREPPTTPPATMAPLPPASIDNSLTIGGEDIDARDLRTRMTVPILIDGHGPYRFIVDSGADTSVIGAHVAHALDLPAGTPATLNGITASGRVERVLVSSLGMGRTTIDDLQLPVLLERDLGADGMLGIDALAGQRLLIDFERKLISVENAERPVPRLPGEIVVTARRLRGQLILTQASAAGRPVDAVIDTGSEITIGNLALRDRLFRNHPARLESVTVTGVTGVTVTLQMARLPELQLGPVILRDVPMAFADVPPFAVFGLSARPALFLGTDLMATFRKVGLDFRRRKVRFQLRQCRSTGVIFSTSPTSASRIALANGGAEACQR